jgi:hypothetical protein
MSLAEHLTTPAPRFKPRCGVATVTAILVPTDLEALNTALADDAFTASEIARALRLEGHNIGDDSVRRHRRGDCTCP